MKRWRDSAWPVIAGLFVLLVMLGATRVLSEPDEGRYAEIGRWMLASGDWIAPRVDGIPFMHKPPYVYWLEAIAIAVFGPHAWAVRLVPAAHALVMLAALYLTARQAVGEATARRAVVMLGTGMAFLLGGQYVNHDMAVAAWIGVAIWSFALFFETGATRPRVALLGFAACALGVLSKGLIGLVLPGLVLLPWLAWTGHWRAIGRLPWVGGVALFAVIALPWFVVGELRYPGLTAYLFGVQQFERYTSPTFNNPRPWWFYLPCLVVLLFPWVAFAPAAARRAPGDAPGDAWRKLGWVWIVAIVAFFSVPRSKLIGYVLPAVPPLALLAALGYERLLARNARWAMAWRAGVVVALVVAAAVQVAAVRESDRRSATDVARWLACAAAPGDTIYTLDGYPYALPFYLRAGQPLVVVADWEKARAEPIDDWRNELLEGVPFDPPTGSVLQQPGVLAEAAKRPGQWLVSQRRDALPGFVPVRSGVRWSVFASAASTAERPPAGQRKRLDGCDAER